MRLRELPKREDYEIANTLRANELVFDLVDRGVELSESMVREINKTLLEDIRQDAGIFRIGPVELPGAPKPPATASDIPDLIKILGSLFDAADSCDPIVQAAWVHAQFTCIHPFSDGNGRTGRLLQDYALVRRGLHPVGIPSSMRDDYYTCLSDADMGNWNRLVETLCVLELSTISEIEEIAHRPKQRAVFIRNLSTAAAQKERETKHRKYVIWKTCVESLIRDFKAITQDLNDAPSSLAAEAIAYEIPPMEVWENHGRKRLSSFPLLLSIVFKEQGGPLYKTILSLRNHLELSNDLFESQSELTGIYLTGTDLIIGENQSNDDYDDPHISLREIVFLDSNLYVYKHVEDGECWDCIDDLSIEEVSEQLFGDVFYRKIGIAS